MDPKVKPAREWTSCRNCGSGSTVVAQGGYLLPFFQKRVLGLDAASLGETLERAGRGSPRLTTRLAYFACRLFRTAPLVRTLFNYRGRAMVPINICMDCGFVGPHQSFSAEQLSGLYKDYRSDTYNHERCHYEPGYAAIQLRVGKDVEEIRQRLDNVEALLRAHVDLNALDSVLDWGGGEGRFIPPSLADKRVHVLDISSEPLADTRYVRLGQPEAGLQYDYIQLCHVLEHVSHPHELLAEVIQHLRPGGLLYIEVPQDRSDAELALFKTAPERVSHGIHEHLNLYSVSALAALGKSLGLTPLAVKSTALKLAWMNATVISGLFRAPASRPRST